MDVGWPIWGMYALIIGTMYILQTMIINYFLSYSRPFVTYTLQVPKIIQNVKMLSNIWDQHRGIQCGYDGSVCWDDMHGVIQTFSSAEVTHKYTSQSVGENHVATFLSERLWMWAEKEEKLEYRLESMSDVIVCFSLDSDVHNCRQDWILNCPIRWVDLAKSTIRVYIIKRYFTLQFWQSEI